MVVGLCKACGRPKPALVVEQGDDFCSTECARGHSTKTFDASPSFPVRGQIGNPRRMIDQGRTLPLDDLYLLQADAQRRKAVRAAGLSTRTGTRDEELAGPREQQAMQAAPTGGR